MTARKTILSLFVVLSFSALLLVSPKQVSAFSFGDLFNGIKNAITAPFAKHELTIDQKIELAQGGDINKNGQIDAGDSVKFSYTISNTTNNSYKTVTLNTNINTTELNTISDVQGVLSLDTEKDTITIPHLTIKTNQVRTISFVARVNFNKDDDKSISTEAELIDEKKSSLFKAQKKEVNAKKLDAENFNKFVHISK